MSAVNKNMAPCRTCGEQIAKTAKVCPKCGEKKPIKKSKGSSLLLFLGGMALITVASCLDEMNMTPEQKAQRTAEATKQTERREAEDRLAEACRIAIMGSVKNVSTLDLDLTGNFTTVQNGDQQYVWGFSAKNSFGLELYQKAYCTFTKDGKFRVRIVESPR